MTYDKKAIVSAIKERIQNNNIVSENIYGAGNSGQKIADVLAQMELVFHKKIAY